MDWRTALLILWEHPLLVTGNETFDNAVHYGSWLAVIGSIIKIGVAFAQAIKQHRRRSPRAKLPRAFWLFLALALASLLVTNGLRFEHKRLKWLINTGQLDLDAATNDTSNWSGALNDVDLRYAPEIRARRMERVGVLKRGSVHLWDVSHPVKRIEAREDKPVERMRKKVWRVVKDEVRAENGRLPYFKDRTWPSKKTGSWEYFDMLVDTPASFFWTAQWFAGFLAWVLFISVECERRSIPEDVGVAFIYAGAFLSLAAAQCLFFALLLLTPRKRTGSIWVLKKAEAIFATLYSSFFLGVVTILIRNQQILDRAAEKTEGVDKKDLKWFISVWKVFAFMGPLLLPPAPSPNSKMFHNHVPVALVKRHFTVVWSVIALIGCGAQLYSVKAAWDTTHRQQKHSFFLGISTYPWLQNRKPMDHYRNPLMQMLGVPGEHAWINALAFDVLFAGIALACWSVIARLDARGMVRCSLLPWTDWVIEKMKITRYHTLPDIRTSGGLRGGATRSGAEYLLQDNGVDVSSEEEADPPWIKRRSHRASQKTAKRTPSRDPAPSAPRTRGRALRSTSSRAPSQPPELPERRRSRSAGLGISMPVEALRSVSPSAHHRGRAASAVRRSSRVREKELIRDDPEDGGRTLLPAGPAFHDLAGQAEQAGLTLALFAFGGLGMASAAVFGAEELG